jgi:4-hydroxy-L-threonine phosphate dehydrogenase PdxA
MGQWGNEDIIIKKTLKKYKMISGPFSADGAFSDIKTKALYITTYHDQGLIPFKSLNDTKINITLGLNYKRFSPAHGTAQDIKFKDKADNNSYFMYANLKKKYGQNFLIDKNILKKITNLDLQKI